MCVCVCVRVCTYMYYKHIHTHTHTHTHTHSHTHTYLHTCIGVVERRTGGRGGDRADPDKSDDENLRDEDQVEIYHLVQLCLLYVDVRE